MSQLLLAVVFDLHIPQMDEDAKKSLKKVVKAHKLPLQINNCVETKIIEQQQTKNVPQNCTGYLYRIMLYQVTVGHFRSENVSSN